MPTLSGLRRRGYTPESIRNFCEAIGVAKNDSMIDIALLEYHLRQDLNKHAPRRMAVLDPIKVVLTNYPEGKTEWLDAINNPEDESAGTRKITFSRELYIERDDFREEAPRKYHRLAPGREVRLRYGYFIKYQDVVKDEEGNILEIHCTYDRETRGGYAPDGRKVRGTIHWVSVPHAIEAEIRLYDRLFVKENPLDTEEGKTYLDYLNPDSLQVLNGCKLEPGLADAAPGERFQFERKGYFCVDKDSTPEHLVFNRTVTLRDSWAKIAKRAK